MSRKRPDGLVISRKGYDAWLRAVAVDLGAPPERAREAVNAEYPKSSADALIECRSRGILATEFNMSQWARGRLRPVSGLLLWQKGDIDRFIRAMRAKRRFTEQSVAAFRLGRSEKDFLRLVRALAFSGQPRAPAQQPANTSNLN